jgi:hypothetical protein
MPSYACIHCVSRQRRNFDAARGRTGLGGHVRTETELEDEKEDQEYEEKRKQEEDNEDTRTKIGAAPEPVSAAVFLIHAAPPKSASLPC